MVENRSERAERILRGLMESQRIDRAAGYAQRGRKYRPLGNDELIAKWLASVKAMAEAPQDPACYAENEDTEAELILRNIDPPYERAQADFDRYMETSEAVLRALKSDPKKLQALKDVLVKEVMAFQDEQDWSS